jgi:hypothetical protein
MAALEEAADEERGYFDPKEECTLPAQSSEIQQAAKEMKALDAGSSTARPSRLPLPLPRSGKPMTRSTTTTRIGYRPL